MSIGSPLTNLAVESNAFGLYYDEDEDGTYGLVGSQQLTDYHYNSSSLIGYISGSWGNRDPANSQGIFVGLCVITDMDNGSQAHIEYDYHFLYGILKYELIGYTAYFQREAGIYGFHKAEDESYGGIGSGHDYHCKSSLPVYEVSGCKEHHDSSASGIYEDDTDPEDKYNICLGSRHDYHSLMSNPIDEIIAEKWEVASMAGIFTFHKTSFTTFYAVGSLHPTITIGCMV